ncbi:MAG: efflux RND transporter periplasmic adaptor subunit [Archangium sp.]|nr:efflux RND transporter periplasmic adaptor subunit [Archangium sp.]
MIKRIVIAVIALSVIGVVALRLRESSGDGASAKGAAPERKVPVQVEAAVKRDVPIILEGLGTVTPLATVTVRSRVDGQLESLSFTEGGPVKRGQLLAQIDPRPYRIAVAQSSATLERDLAQQRNLKLTLERFTDLRRQNLVPQQQVDDQQTLVDQAGATVGMDQAAVDNAKLQLDYTRITSPIDGIAGIRQIDPGNLVRASDATGLVVLTQLDPISVVFTLAQDELSRVSNAFSQGPRQVEAWSRDGRTLLATGELKVIDNQINLTTASLRLRAQFDNSDRALWPNQFVKARLHVESKQNALVVSASAVQRGQQGTFVYVVGADRTAQLKPVEVDFIEGSVAVLKSGIAPGELVVIDGQAQLKPGAAVDPRQAGGGKQVADARTGVAP